jgi:hypothetical protein
MLTIFTSAKPFRGRTAVIQRNALRSWMLLHPAVQIILFGDAEGSQEVAWEFGIHYEEHPFLTASGSVRLDYMFTTAQRRARYSTLCYVPCDTVLLPDFYDALTRVEALYREFLMVGRSCHLDFGAPLQFGDPDWQGLLRQRAEMAGHKILPKRAAYVGFSKGTCLADVPPIAVDSPVCMAWLLWKALSEQVTVVDASDMVLAVQQQHADSRGEPCGPPCDEGEAEQSVTEALAVCGSRRHLRSVGNAPYLLTTSDVVRNRWRGWHSWQARAAFWGTRAWQAWQKAIWQPRKLGGTAMAQGVRANNTPR